MSFKNIIFIFGLILFPILCSADMGMPSVFTNFGGEYAYLSAILIFSLICLLEGYIIRGELKEDNEKKVVRIAFIINLVTLLIGYIFFFLNISFFINNIYFIFTATVIVEFFLLYLFFRDRSILKLLLTSIVMNVSSYFILFLLFALLGLIELISLAIIIYLIILALLKKTKMPISIVKIIAMILSILSIFSFFYFRTILIEKGILPDYYSFSPSKRDARIKADMDQLRTAAEVYKATTGEGKYSFLNYNVDASTCDIDNTFLAPGTDGNKACKDADLMIKGGLIVRMNSGTNENDVKYCVQKELNSNNYSFCVDYTGYAGSDINYNGCDSVNFDCKNDN